jgi:bifunctional DNA-binding transcriptional regulator/antitoxin component of YhaV-PrlF toxin-antitoxin module
MQSAINAEGQMTPPKQILDHLGVKPGDQVRFFIHPDGTVVMLPTRPVTDLRGMIKYAGPPATIEEMDEAIADAAMERDARSRE